MNRKKKVNEILKKRLKKTNAKLHRSNKPRYISKAERAEMESDTAQDTEQTSETGPILDVAPSIHAKADNE